MYHNPISTQNHRVVSGMRATGSLHLGNYYGALKGWIELQQKYDCFFFIADWHALTTEYEKPDEIRRFTKEILLDWLGAGLDPKKCAIFVQSHVQEVAELHLLLSMLVPLSWLERVPTYKELRANLAEKHLATYGFLGYPALQGADILIYKTTLVPVGEDQVPHVELAREMARHFNHLYQNKRDTPLFLEPQSLLTKTTKLPGLDGRKMSKSYHNTIGLREDPQSVTHKIKTMPTDPARVRRTDPGEPEKCPVWRLHQVFSNEETQAWVQKGCRTAGIGCLDCKKPVIDAILAEQKPIRERAESYLATPQKLDHILEEGREKARAVASETLRETKEMMGLMAS